MQKLFLSFQQTNYLYLQHSKNQLFLTEKNRRASFGPILDCYNRIRIRIVISLSYFFFKKKTFFNNKERNISNQSSRVIDPIGIQSSSKLMHLVFYLKVYDRFDF